MTSTTDLACKLSPVAFFGLGAAKISVIHMAANGRIMLDEFQPPCMTVFILVLSRVSITVEIQGCHLLRKTMENLGIQQCHFSPL